MRLRPGAGSMQILPPAPPPRPQQLTSQMANLKASVGVGGTSLPPAGEEAPSAYPGARIRTRIVTTSSCSTGHGDFLPFPTLPFQLILYSLFPGRAPGLSVIPGSPSG